MLNIRQTDLYARFMRSLNWQTLKLDENYIYIRKFPFIPAYAKMQRPTNLPDFERLRHFMKEHKLHSLSIEPLPQKENNLINNFPKTDPLTFTKNIYISLHPSEEKIFARFSEAKRRAVRRAQKFGIQVEVNSDIESFIRLKNKTAGLFLGFLHTYGFIRHMWKSFYPDHTRVILAKIDGRYEAGILLFFINKTAYYWMASATKKGKKTFAPTLLVWEALKFAKKEECILFDFEGVYDERFPKRNKAWQGFSKFKEGFGGDIIYYPQAFLYKS